MINRDMLKCLVELAKTGSLNASTFLENYPLNDSNRRSIKTLDRLGYISTLFDANADLLEVVVNPSGFAYFE